MIAATIAATKFNIQQIFKKQVTTYGGPRPSPCRRKDTWMLLPSTGGGGGARETSEIIVHSNEKWFAMEKCKYTVYRLHIVFFFVFR